MADLDPTDAGAIAAEIRAHGDVSSRSGQTAALYLLAGCVERLPQVIAAQVREQAAKQVLDYRGPNIWATEVARLIRGES